MSLVYKSSVRDNVTDIQTYIVDNTPKSTKYFRVSDVPQVLQKGKNLLRITAHPTNLVPGTQVYVDVRDSNGNPIYYEIPDYLENDKSRVISIWVYHDKGEDNTPNGEATITLVGIANVDMDGKPLPQKHRGKLNVKWQTTVNVDRERDNTSEIIFDPNVIPSLIVSQSVEAYQNQPQSGDGLNLTSQTGKVQYIFKGETPIVEIKDSGTLNGEMVGGSIILNNFTKPAEPISNIANPLSSTFFSSSIKEVLTNKVLKPATNFTTSFSDRTDLTHTFDFVSEADYKIQYFQSGSNVNTENKRNFANITLNNIDPITGVVDKIKILHKSDGLPGDFELLNEVEVPFSSSVSIKVPIPSKNLKDPKILKLLYLNSEGSISRTQTLSNPFVFDGDNVYIGGSENLISGSIYISNTLGTGIEIGGASSGFIRSVGFDGQTSASLGKAPGGFVIYSGSGNLKMGEDFLNGVGMQFIGDNDDRHLIFTTDGGGLLDVKTDKFFIGTENTQFISGSDGAIEISSSIFHLNPSANGGEGSLVIGANATINADLTVDNLRTPASIGGVASTETNSSSSIKADGFARFVSASIGGWGITTSSIEGGNLLMKPEGILQTRDFASGLKGWKISSEGNGTAEFENIRIRGTLRTTTFEKESVNAVGGQLWVANSTTITGSIGTTDTTMSVKNASGFAAGEILLAKKVDNTGFQTEYFLLESASVDGDNSNEDETFGRIYVQRAYGSGQSGDFVGDLASSAQSYEDGQVVVSTGKLNTGYIKMNANPNDTATPFIDIVERTGSGLYDVALKARLGDLSGLANSSYVFGNSDPGFGLATDNVYLQGGIIANTGSIGGINMDAGKLFTGAGTYGNSNTGFYVDSGSQFSLGNKLVWNPSTEALVIRGQLQLADGTDVGTAIDEVSSPTGSIARTVELSADKYVITFDAAGNESPSGQSITLTATPQNFGTATVYYEFYKDSTIQGARSTTNTFTVDNTAEKPTASTPKTYEVRTFTGSDGGTSVTADSLTLFGIQPGSDGTDGQDAVTAFLTNESHTLPLSSSGVVQSYAGADTEMKVFEGVTDATSNYTYTISKPSHITTTQSTNTITVTNTTTPHSGSVTITATSASVSLSKIMSIGTTRQGDDGTDGTPGVNGSNAKTLVASVDSQVFAFDDSTDNSATPGSILFTFSQQNLNDTIQSSDITITTADSNSVTNFSFDNNDVSDGTGIVSGSISYTGAFNVGGLSGAKTSLPITISCTNDSLTDSIKVFKVEGGSDGADAVTAFLTNESHTLPSQNDGTVVSFSGAETDMIVFEGVTDKTNSYTFSRTSATSVSSSISPGSNTITITSMAHDSGSVIITATSASVSLSKTMTLAKSKQGTAGLAGSDAKLLSLTSDSQVFAFPSASSSTPEDNDILIIVNQQNLSGTVDAGDITIKDAGGNTLTDPTFVASVTDGTGQVSGSITFSGMNSTVGGDKTKLPLTIEVSKDSLEDSLKIFKIDGGNEGQDGADAVTAFLTNESHTFAADSTGAIASFTGGSTDMEVFEGITNSTSNYTISKTDGTGVTSSVTDNTVTISAMAHDSGSITINASSGSVSIDKIMSLVKSKQGPDGSDGTSAKLLIGTLDSQVMAFDDSSDTTATPTSVEFSFQQQNLAATIQSSDINISLNGGGNITNFEFNNSDVSNGTGIVSGSFTFAGATNSGGMGSDKSKFPVLISATKDSLQDAVKVFKVEGGADGTDSVQVILSNESHTLAAQSDGTVISFTGADTDVTVFEGITDKTSAYTISRTNGTGVSTTLAGDNIAVTGMTHDSGSVTINAASGSVSINKLMSLTKAKQGQDGDKFADTSITTTINLTTLQEDDTLTFTADTGLAWTAGLTAVLSYDSSNFINGTVNSYNSANGSMSLNVDTITGGGTYTAWSLNVGGVAGPQGLSGANAKNIVASADSQVFSFLSASDNTAEPSSIIFSFNQQNLNNATIGSGDITITGADGTSITNFTLDANDVDSNFSGIVSGSLSFSANTNAGGLGSDKAKLPVTISATKDGLTDSIKIFKVEGGTGGTDGTDAVTAFLTNEAHTFAAANDGTIVSFSGAFTDMEVFEGTTNSTSNYTFTKSDGTGVTSTISTNRVTISALSSDSGSVDITATSGSTTLTKTMSLVKSKQGAQGLAGDDAKMLTITSDSPVFSFASASSSTALDDTIELIINQQNLSATVAAADLVIKDVGGNTLSDPTLAPSSLSNNTGLVSGSITFSGTVGGDKTKLPLEITITQDGLTDSLKIFKVEGGTGGTDGTDAINGFLSNESHTFPADSTGAIASFTGGTSTMSVFEGVTDRTSIYTYSKSDGTGVTSTLGGTDGNVLTISALGHDSGSVDITATSGSGGGQVSITKTMSLTKARQGSDGSDGTSAKLLIGSLNSQVFAFDDSTDTDSDPSSIEFSFQQQNLSGSAGYITIGSSDIDVRDSGNNQITGFTFDNNDVTNGTGIVSGSITFANATNAGGVGGDTTKLPITITATKDGLTDSVKIFKVVGGADGTAGTNAVTALLTNDSHTLPVSSSGNVISFAGANTEMIVFEGTSDRSSNYTFERAAPSHMTTTQVDGTITLTNSTTPFTGSIVITATSGSGGAQVQLSKTMSISQALQGDDGEDGAPGSDAKTITLTGDSQVFTFLSASATTPDDNTIELFINQQNLSGTIAASDVTITDVDGTSQVVPTFAPTSLTNGTGVVSGSLVFGTNTPNGSNKDKFPITISVTKDSVSDTFKIFALDGGADGNDGADAYTVFLTNESHTFPAAANGDVDSSDLAAGATEVRVFKGTTQLTNDNSSPYGANTYRASKTNNGITLSPSVSSSQRKFTPTSVANDSGTATITITDNTTGTAFTKTYTFSKSKEGAEGAAGSDSKTVALTAATNVITYNAAGTDPTPTNTITLTADSQNFTNGYFKFTGDGISDETSYTDGNEANQDTFSFSVPNAYFSSPKTIRVGVSEANQTELAFDTVTIVAVQPGADGAAGSDAVTAILTSEADSVPAASDGTVSSFTGTGTTMQIFEGVTDSTANYTFTVSNTTGFTAGLGGTNNNVLTVSGMSHDSGSSTITATSASGNPGQVQISKVYSVAKSLAGPQGTQGADNQDLTFLNENLTGVGPIASPGLLMTSNVFGFHNGISGTNGSLSDFTSFLDSSGNFYLGGNSSGMSGSAATSGYLAWNNTDRSLLISGSNVNIEVDKFFVGNANTQFISGSNGVIEISGSNFHLDSSGNVSMSGTVNASAGSIAGYTISSTQIAAPGNALLLKSNGQMTGSSIQLKGGSIGGFTIETDRLRGGSNDELILRQSGEITGSKMQMRGGSLGGLYVTSNAIWMETTANQYGPTFDSTKNQFYVDNTGQFSLGKGVVWDGTTLSVEGNISVTNPEDFAAATFAQTFGTSVDTTNRWLVGNVTETKIAGTATQVGYNRYQGSVSDGFNKGIVTRTSFKRSTDATAVWDVVVNDGAGTSTRGSSSKPIHATFGWTDIDASGDITGYGSNLSHVGHGISLDVVTDSSAYYNDVRVYENGSVLANTTVDWESHSNGFTGGPKEGNVPYTTGTQTKLRIEITLKSGGGAVYKIFINNNFAAPAWEYESSTSYGGLNSSEDYYPAMLLYHDATGKQIGIESFTVNGTPKTTTISGNSISTGRIDSTNVSATAGSRIDLDAGTFFLGGTGSNAKLSWNGTTLEVDGTINANAGQIGGLDIGTNLIESTTDLAASAGPAYKLTSAGVISGSNLYVRQVVDIGNGDEVYPVLDTEVGLIDARNNGRQVVADNNQYYRINTDDSSTTYEVANYVFHLMPYETTLTIAGIFTAYSDGTSTNARLNGNLDLEFQRMSLSGSAAHSDSGLSTSPGQTTGLGAGWYTVNNDITAGGFSTGFTGTSTSTRAKTKVLHGEDSKTYTVPSSAQAQMCRLVLKIGCDGLYGFIPTVNRGVMLQGLSVIATRELAAATIGYGQSELNPTTRSENA